MRKFIAIALCTLLVTPVFTQAQNPVIGSAVKNSFREVSSHLDAGGNLYLYLSTEEWVNGLSSQVSQLRDVVNGVSGGSASDKQNVAHLFDLLAKLVKQSGVEEISGFGMSSIALDEGLYRSRWILHHYRGNDTGFLWSAFGRQPHVLDELDLLPANTAFASFSDLDLPMLWSVIEQAVRQSGTVEAQQTIQTLRTQFGAMTGGDPDRALASIGNECGLVFTLEQTSTLNSRSSPPASPMPDFGLMLICKVKNDTIFDLIDSTLKSNPHVIRTDRSDLRMRTIPGSSRMSFARSGDYLFVASTAALIEASVSIKAGKRTGLRATDEFKKLSQGLPEQGNSFTFRSQRIADLAVLFQSRAFAGNSATNNPAQQQLLANVFGTPGAAGAYHVSSNTSEGWVSSGNSGQNPATTLFLLPTMAATLIAATVGIPNLMRSRQAANEAAAIGMLRTIATAEVTYLSASRSNYGDTRALVQAGLLDPRMMSTVSGYVFAINISSRGYTATATPVSPDEGRYGYSVTTDNVVRYSPVPAQAPPGQNGHPVQ